MTQGFARYIIAVDREFKETFDAGEVVMDGKRHFRDCCKTLELDCDNLFQLGKCSVPVSGRLRHRFDFQKRKKSQIFAVCYVEKENVYVAWNLKVKKAAKKSMFSVKWSDVDRFLGNTAPSTSKAIEYQGWGEEIVHVFTPEMIPQFLKRYCGGCA